MQNEITFIGTIKRVTGAKLFVELSDKLPSLSPIIEGRIHRVGHIGSFVRIPLGAHSLYGIVSLVGSSDIGTSGESQEPGMHGQRWIEVNLVGETDEAGAFRRGVSTFPMIDDEVHLVTDHDLQAIYGRANINLVQIGTHAESDAIPAWVDMDKILTRHACIVGSTGSGKSNAVACFVQSVTSGCYPNAAIVLIDPHGEYSTALQDQAKVLSIDSRESPLIIPFWAMSYDELAWFLVDRKSASESPHDARLRDKILEFKRRGCGTLKAGPIPEIDVTVDSPIYFNLSQIWYELYEDEHATLRAKDDWSTVAYKKDGQGNELKGNPSNAESPQYEPPGTGPTPPFKSTRSIGLGGYLNKIQGRLRDPKFDFMLEVGSYNGVDQDLDNLIATWVCHEKPITILDLGGIPSEVADIVVGVVTRVLFEALFWSRDLPGIGRQRPVLLVFEEAHAYLGRSQSQFVSGYALRAVRKVFKEGRKLGMGAILVSQRPSELDDTLLSQCGTFMALRLSNTDDQSRIRATLPESLGGIVELLPALRTGEAVIVGEGVTFPSRIRFPLVEPRPASDDPKVAECWAKKPIEDHQLSMVATRWRKQSTG